MNTQQSGNKNALGKLAGQARIVVTVGSGGVGKTTTAALIGLEAALQGRKALVMTIDPAKRLADALGLEELGHTIQEVPLPEAQASGGGLWATMLDMKETFDSIVDRYAESAETRDAIRGNRFYHFFSTSLAGAQELSASERLFEVAASGDYDLIVLDTPPTANALDFLEAPTRFFEALDGKGIQWIIAASGRARGKGVLSLGTQFILKTLSRFTGGEFFEELGTFLLHFSGLLDGIAARSRETLMLLGAPDTWFVIVTSPDPATVEEALDFRGRLEHFGVQLGGVVVNRTHQRFENNPYTTAPLGELADALGAIPGGDHLGNPMRLRLARLLIDNAQAFDGLAARDNATIEALRQTFGADLPIIRVPMYASDVHTIPALLRMRRDLFDG